MSEETQEALDQADSQAGARLVPVAESIKYRRRAQQAETRLQELEQRLTDLQAHLECRNDELATAESQRDEARHQLGAAEGRLAAERMLAAAGVVDVETASLLLAKRIDFGDDLDRDAIERAVEQIMLDKPFLRGAGAALPPATASLRSPQTSPAAQLASVAERAARTGDRRDVAEYLRLRRHASRAGARPAATAG